jgi:flagellar biosynthesis/type III secretory pathway chaperone
MDSKTINPILIEEIEELGKLLELLEEQHELLLANDIFKLEEIIDRIKQANKGVAKSEVERRKITKNESMKVIISQLNDSELEDNYRKVLRVLNEIKVQKETNDMLIKMGLGYSARVLGILSPERNSTTYTSRGNYKK